MDNEEIYNMHSSPDISRMMAWAGHVARMIAVRNAYRNSDGIKKGRAHLGDLSIDGRVVLKKVLEVIAYQNVYWIHLTLDRDHWHVLFNTVINIPVP